MREQVKKKYSSCSGNIVFSISNIPSLQFSQSGPEVSGTLPHNVPAIQHPAKQDTLLNGDRFPPKFWLMPKGWPTCKILQGQHVTEERVSVSNTDPLSQLGHWQAQEKCNSSLQTFILMGSYQRENSNDSKLKAGLAPSDLSYCILPPDTFSFLYTFSWLQL